MSFITFSFLYITRGQVKFKFPPPWQIEQIEKETHAHVWSSVKVYEAFYKFSRKY